MASRGSFQPQLLFDVVNGQFMPGIVPGFPQNQVRVLPAGYARGVCHPPCGNFCPASGRQAPFSVLFVTQTHKLLVLILKL